MTTELRKTLAFVAVAVLLTGAAFVRLPDRTGSSSDFNDQGQQFFPAFKNALDCTDLEVVEFDTTNARPRVFKVMFNGGKWVIPSHNNYPADAKDRLAKTAAGVMDLTKDTIRSDRAEDHEAFGVIEPDSLDPKAPLKGRGKRVTLRDKSGRVLAEFLIGNEVRERQGMRYVRVPGQKRTYGVNVNADLSTRFADWIETNLLKLDAGRIRSVTFDNYKVDPEAGTLKPGEKLTVSRKNSGDPWTFSAAVPEGQELNAEKLSALTTALSDLKIVGVRPKPVGLIRELKAAESLDVKNLTSRSDVISLMNRGFYPTQDGRLLSNQGEVVVKTDEGAVYTLRYGEVVFSSGEELEAGAKDEGKTKGEPKKAEGTAENRFLMVTVGFDPSLLPEPEKPKEELVIPDDPFQKAPDDPKRVAEEKAAKEKADREKADREKRIADAEKKVKDLSDRFADWYYVTPGDSFRSVSLDRAALLRPKGEKKAEGPPPSIPGFNFPGGAPGSFPGGMPHP